MSPITALLIFALVTVLAIVLSLPIIYWLRRRRRKQKVNDELNVLNARLTLLQALPGLIFAAVLATAFLTEYIAPSSWFGQRISGWEGKVWFFIFGYICVTVIELTFRAFARKRPNE